MQEIKMCSEELLGGVWTPTEQPGLLSMETGTGKYLRVPLPITGSAVFVCLDC